MFYKKLLLSFLLFLSLGTLFAEASDTEMLLRLDGHLNAIRREHQLSRQIVGGVLIGCGVIFAGSSFYFLSFSQHY